MREISTEEMKGIQLDILRHVDAFCKENHIQYFLTGGSLLGAIRHKGFIPWDDDIDIVMLREEYERFEQLYGNIGYSHYHLHSYQKNTSFPYPFMKVDDTRTVFQEEINNRYEIGVNIDIFPADTLPDDEQKRKKLFAKIRRLVKLLTLKRLPIKKRRGIRKNLMLFTGQLLLKPIPTRWLVKEIIRKSCSFRGQNSPYIGNCMWGVGIRETIRKECFSSAEMAPFEGELFPIPVGYDEFLSSLFGDYMQPPPEDKRITHHNYRVYYKEDSKD